MSMMLKEKTAIVTGAGQGIGQVIAQTLAAAGARVAVNDIQRKNVEETVRAIIDKGGDALGVPADVTDESQVEKMVADVSQKWGEIGILVNNAAILILHEGKKLPIWQMPAEEWNKTMEVNLRGTFLCSKHVLKTMVKRSGEGRRIINISSSAAKLGGFIASSAYVTSKAGIIGFTKIMAREVAPYGITVNAVAPGMVSAPMMRLSTPPENDHEASANVPLGRLAEPEEIAEAVLFLSSQASSYMTGATLDVNGGWAMY